MQFFLGVGLSQLIVVNFICDYLLEITPDNYLLISVLFLMTFLTKCMLLIFGMPSLYMVV